MYVFKKYRFLLKNTGLWASEYRFVFPEVGMSVAVLYSLGDHRASSKETKIRPIGCMLCKVSTVLSLSWFYLSFGCIFRTVLGMTI